MRDIWWIMTLLTSLHTRLRDEGIHYQPGDTVTVYDPVTGEITNSEVLSDELDFDVEQFNKTVITRPLMKRCWLKSLRILTRKIQRKKEKPSFML